MSPKNVDKETAPANTKKDTIASLKSDIESLMSISNKVEKSLQEIVWSTLVGMKAKLEELEAL